MRAPTSSRKSSTWITAALGVALLGGGLALWAASGEPDGARNAPAPAARADPAPALAHRAPAVAPPSAPAVEPLASVQAAPAPSLEEEVTVRLRTEAEEHPDAAVLLADDAEQRFPGGPHAEERAYLKMRALVHLGDIVAARDAATRFFDQHPQSALGRYVFRLTGMRPRPGPGH